MHIMLATTIADNSVRSRTSSVTTNVNDTDTWVEAVDVLVDDIVSDFSIFELLIHKMNEKDFGYIDWECLSNMKGLSKGFIRAYFRYFNIKVLLTANLFDGKFIEEIFDKLIPFNEKKFKIVYDMNCLFKICVANNRKNLSDQFLERNYPPLAGRRFVKQKTKGTESVPNDSFELLVCFIKEIYPKVYFYLDIKNLSSYRVLSHNFIVYNIDRLDINQIIQNQNIDAELLLELKRVGIKLPLNALLNKFKYTFSLQDLIYFCNFKDIFNDAASIIKLKENIYKGIVRCVSFNFRNYILSKEGLRDDGLLPLKEFKEDVRGIKGSVELPTYL